MASLDLSTLRWRKSSRSSNYGNCVEVAFSGPAVVARDSKAPDDARLVFSAVSWASFLGRLRAGRFDA
ncbi:DUF397 domain-containing protein [Saccharopolyspora phatthalungensis]|uniref:DUF397 domain-containing protein n=1 Tax=Saccharopolyspora phatthalungensis TaxID=664693 RepID=UPI00161BA6A4|nr:DUF397 domain-containing protein [Saccharopolyspora phatthalungensis]